MSIFEFINWVTQKKQKPILSVIVIIFINWQMWLIKILPHGLNIAYGVMLSVALFAVIAHVGVMKEWFFKFPRYDIPFVPKTRQRDDKEHTDNLGDVQADTRKHYQPKSASPTFDGTFDEILFYCKDKSFGKVFYGLARSLFRQIWLVLLTGLCVANVWLILLAIIGMFWSPHPVSHIAINPEEMDDVNRYLNNNSDLLHDPRDYH